MAAHATLLADDSAIEPLKAMGGMHACINFAPSAATWPLMVAGIKPRGRIVATAMVSQPVPISQEWFTGTGVAITGTSVGTRLEMRKLLRMHKENPLLMHINEIPFMMWSKPCSIWRMARHKDVRSPLRVFRRVRSTGSPLASVAVFAMADENSPHADVAA